MDKKHVVIFSNRMTVDGQERLRGITRYLERHADWDATFLVNDDELTAAQVHAARRRGVDGFLVDFCIPDEILTALAKVPTPVVTIDVCEHPLCDGRSGVRNVYCDHESVAVTAARHFLDQGRFHSFGFLSGGFESAWPVIRQRAFVRTLAEQGIFCHLYENSGEGADRKNLARWLRQLPKPAAILAANDTVAVRLLRLAEDLKMKVPNALAVLGVDNDELFCTNTRPTLSSIAPDFEEEGFRAAEALDALMRAPTQASTEPIRVPVATTVVRESSSPVNHAGNLVRRALQFIDRNASKRIAVEDVVRHLGVSRRLLYLRFQEIQGTTPKEAIRTRRLELARHRLAMTHETIAEIAASCGFTTENHLMHLFKKRFGVSMCAFRQNKRGQGN